MMARVGSWQKRMRGATTVELLYMLPVFFMLTFAIIEAAFVYRMRSTLNVASFHAARAGANQHALLQPMQEKLAEGLIPLYMKGSSDPSAYATAFASSMQVLGTLLPARNPVTIISPTKSAFDVFSEQRRVQMSGDETVRNLRAIPNDNLRWRSPQTRNVSIDGESRPINLQDANLLKISTYWCYHLKTPALNRLVNAIVSGTDGLGGTPEQQACNVVGAADGKYYLAVTSQAIVRMQSDIVFQNNNLK